MPRPHKSYIQTPEVGQVGPLGARVAPSGGLGRSDRPVSPSRRPREVLAKVFAAVFELVANKPNPVEVGAHGEFLVLDLRLAAAGAALGERLMVEGQGEDDVAAYLARVQLAVEAP